VGFNVKKILILLLLLSQVSLAQRGNIWVFGDSAFLDVNQNSTIQRSSAKASVGSTSIADDNGSFLFFVESRADNFGYAYNSNNQYMVNGTNIFNRTFFHSSLILPFPEQDSLYYLFHLNLLQLFNRNGVYYTLINPLKNGIGEVLQKNIFIQNNVYPSDVLAAVKHGNGRDWWVFWRNYDKLGLDTSNVNFQKNNTYNKTLLTPLGLDPISTQNIGTPSTVSSFGDIAFSKQGDKLAYCSLVGLIELFDFDRCNGILSNPITIRLDTIGVDNLGQISLEFSPNGRFVYVSEWLQDTSKLYQYDLQSTNVFNSRALIDEFIFPDIVGMIERWVDDKVYISIADSTSINGLLDSTEYTITNTHLSVINNPDFPFPQCNYVRNGFSLNGARTFQSLPNNPNYDLGASIGSICDTLSVGIAENNSEENDIKISPNPVGDNLMLSYKLRYSQQGIVYIYDLLGKLIFSRQVYGSGTQLLIHTENFQRGMYVISVDDNGKRMNKKFVKE